MRGNECNTEHILLDFLGLWIIVPFRRYFLYILFSRFPSGMVLYAFLWSIITWLPKYRKQLDGNKEILKMKTKPLLVCSVYSEVQPRSDCSNFLYASQILCSTSWMQGLNLIWRKSFHGECMRDVVWVEWREYFGGEGKQCICWLLKKILLCDVCFKLVRAVFSLALHSC